MKTPLFILAWFFTIIASAQNTISFEAATRYINSINGVLGGKELYLRAVAYSYAPNSPVTASDMGQFIIARSGQCAYMNFKEQETYLNSNHSVQIDTMEKSIMVSKPSKLPYSDINISDFSGCQTIVFRQVKGSSYMLIFKLKPGNEYKQVQVVFDTMTMLLQKITMEYDPGSTFYEMNIQKVEIVYHQVLTKVPQQIETCLADDIIRISRKNEVQVKSPKYQQYTIINLLEL